MAHAPNGARRATRWLAAAAGGAAVYGSVATGRLTLDLGVGQRSRPLGPIVRSVAASPDVVFDVIAGPYLHKTPRAMGEKLRVVERGTDMVLAEHFTPIGFGLASRTLEVVTFERPERIHFRLVRGPVPHVTETFVLTPTPDGTDFGYSGEIGADLWALGSWWAGVVARRWERAVADSMAATAAEAERRAARTRTGT